ncbi:hypothetical protein B566_EDAN001773 [Ephemera danica]|nr:hypothetical protein B566_EDAN001773 [Ephemera danica]
MVDRQHQMQELQQPTTVKTKQVMATPNAGTPATNNSEDQTSDGGEEVEIVSVQLATPEEVEKARRLHLPDNFYLYRLRPECPGCRGCRDTEATPVTPVIHQIKPLVNGKSEKAAGEQPIAFLPTEDKISFASLANQSNTDFASPPTTSFTWAGAGTPVFGGGKVAPVFGSTTKNTPTKSDKEGESSGDEEGGEDETHDPHFEPIVALPDAIEVKTGEEEEEKLFCQRAKLYRYSADLKEWKERGVGEIKVLHHKVNGTYRLLMRREQVHKLVLNQLLNPATTLSRMATNSNAWCWAGLNYAEDEAKLEELAVRFKNEDIMKEFYDRVEECKTALLAKQSQVPQPTPVEAAVAQPGETPAEEAAAGAAAVATSEEEEEEEEDYETYDEDEDDDEDEEAAVVFEKRVTLTTKGPSDPDNKWQTLGQGTLRMVHSGHLCNMRVHVEADDSGELLCNIPIDTEAKVELQDKDCTFSGLDEILPNPVQRHFKAKFSSSQAAEEFKINFMEGLSLAEQAEMYGDEEEEEDDEDGEE